MAKIEKKQKKTNCLIKSNIFKLPTYNPSFNIPWKNRPSVYYNIRFLLKIIFKTFIIFPNSNKRSKQRNLTSHIYAFFVH